GQPLAVPEDAAVRIGQVGGTALGHLRDELRFLGSGEPQARVQALAHRRVARGPAEDERDRGQQPGGVEPLDDQRAARRPDAEGRGGGGGGGGGGAAGRGGPAGRVPGAAPVPPAATAATGPG